MLPVHIQVSNSIPWCDLEDHSSEPTCLRQSAARRSGPGCRSRHRRASAGSSWTRLSTALCLSQVRQCAVSFRSHRMTNKIVLRRPIESALHAPVAVMHQAAALNGSAVMQRLLEGIEDEARMRRPGDAPPDDAPGEGVDDERHVNKALPGGYIGVSGPEELHLRPLAEPDVNLSAHPA